MLTYACVFVFVWYVAESRNTAAKMDLDDLTPIIQNVIVMDSEGKRIAVKYYTDEW